MALESWGHCYSFYQSGSIAGTDKTPSLFFKIYLNVCVCLCLFTFATGLQLIAKTWACDGAVCEE